jgi:PAS domain-containing protein
MIIQIDTNMRILWANKTALDMNPDAVGQTCYKAFIHRDDPCEGYPCEKCMNTGQIEKGIVYQPAVKGVQGERYWENIGVPIKDSAGRIVGAIVICRNVAEQKRAKEILRDSERKYRELFNTTPNGVAVYEAVDDGENFIFKDYNRAAEQIDRVGREDVIGKSVLKIFPGVKDFGLFEVFRRVWATGKPEHHPVSLYKD